MSNEIIRLSKISKKFSQNKKDIIVLRNINLKIEKGKLISLTGPSGSGKSTLLHIIALLDKPTSGEVFFKKKSFSKSEDNQKDLVRKNGISIIYQQNNLLSDFTALENVAIPLINNRYSNYQKILYRLPLFCNVKIRAKSSILKHHPISHGGRFSGGNQQIDVLDFSSNTSPAGMPPSV